MLLAWKKAHRFEASTFLLIDSVCAPLPSVSDSARHSAITAIRSAIFLFSPEACSACSACSMLSCALMIPPPDATRHDCRMRRTRQGASGLWQAHEDERPTMNGALVPGLRLISNSDP